MVGLVVVVALALPSSAAACSCVGRTAMQGLSMSDAVFVGTVITITREPDTTTTYELRPPIIVTQRFENYAVTFRVLKYWKGAMHSTATLKVGIRENPSRDSAGGTVFSTCSGGVLPEVGGHYLVYANRDKNDLTFSTAACTMTRPTDAAALNAELELGPGMKPTR